MSMHVDQRPKLWKQVYGNTEALKALREALKSDKAHAFILHGPAGTGKTTVARLIAKQLEVDPLEVREIDAATHTGIEAMRTVSSSMRYYPMHGSRKAVIVDEAHALSKAAWQSLLKSIEEPPSFAYWIFCTTELQKIIPTIRTRCILVPMRQQSAPELAKIIKSHLLRSGQELDEDAIDLCAKHAGGSPRQAVVNATLALCAGSAEEVEGLITGERADDSDAVIKLCRVLGRGSRSWGEYADCIAEIREAGTSAETVRQIVLAYFERVALGKKKGDPPWSALAIIEAFAQTSALENGMFPVALALGRLLRSSK